MPRRSRRDLEIFSLSFLDCVCCALGALILLFVISMGSDRLDLERLRDELLALLARREVARAAAFAEVDAARTETAAEAAARAAVEVRRRDAEAALADEQRALDEARAGAERLAAELERVQPELDARQRLADLPQNDPRSPVGVPVDRDHLVFIVDTSGSMRDPLTGQMLPAVTRKIAEILASYPDVRGLQLLDADGRFLVPGTAGSWIPDRPENRRRLLDVLARNDTGSQSNLVPGILRALATYARQPDPERKIGLYLFGDEFVLTTEEVLDRLDRANPREADGRRRVSINAVGFPHIVLNERLFTRTGQRFALLMREVTWRHDGAFVGLTE